MLSLNKTMTHSRLRNFRTVLLLGCGSRKAAAAARRAGGGR